MKALKKLENKKVLFAYLLGVLLLSFGASFSYFVATSSVTGEGITASNTTATIESEGLVADGNVSFNNTDIYPGHTVVASIKVTGKGNNVPILFHVIFNGENTFNTPIRYTIYKSNTNINASYSCSKNQAMVNGSIRYYEECSENNISSLGTAIGSGTIMKGNGKTTLKNDEIILATENGEEVYYYIVFEYPNEEANQNDDLSSFITGNITIEEASEYQEPSFNIVTNTIVGNNGWYKIVSLTTNITTETGNYEAAYCLTTEDSCTPNNVASITDNSFDITLSSNVLAQKLCIRVTDEYNQIGEGCSNAYQVDNTNPSVNITSTSATENSISVTVNGNDTHSGIYQYRFSSNNGSSYTDVTTSDSSYTYTFTGLSAGTTYNIVVQIMDAAGNVSNATQAIETENPYAARDYILAGKNISTRTNFSTAFTENTTGTIYQAEDDDGTTYYYAGAPTDNWVSFAGFYWRIIRINGDGTIRLIYQGTGTNATGSGTQIGTNVFNESWDNNAYVGYMYTLNNVHGIETNSSIKERLDTWYSNNIGNISTYSSKVDINAGFCNDRYPSRSPSHSDGLGGTGTTATYYGAYYRTSAPVFGCTSSNDLFTVNGANKGNGALTYPIGLITIDEVWYAGGYQTSNTGYYLYTAQNYWTMTPREYANGSSLYIVHSSGTVSWSNPIDARGVRPVINLKADVELTGSGTSTDPYIVVGT